MLIILLVSGLVLILGILGCVRAIGGRLVSEHPHCRACRFDLFGLELTKESRCPECGNITPPDTRYVQSGLRKRRYGLLAVSLLMLLIGGGGLAWPKLSQMPSIKNIDWYAKYPEGFLLLLEKGGDGDALQELHDRLIPGTLSDSGLQKLIARSLSMIDDETVTWDERWGDVLLYAMLTDRIEKNDLKKYLEGMIIPVVHQHDQLRVSDHQFRTRLVLYGKERGSCSSDWSYILEQAGLFGSVDPPRFVSRLEYNISIETEGKQIRDTQTTGTRGGWSPASAIVSQASAQCELSSDHGVIDVVYQCQLEILLGGEPIHTWAIEVSSRSVQAGDDVEYAVPVDDFLEVNKLISSLFFAGFMIPEDIGSAMSKPELRSMTLYAWGIQGNGETDIGLIGTLSVFDEHNEIMIANGTSIPWIEPGRRGVSQAHVMGWAYRVQDGDFHYMLEDFYRDREFWGGVWRRRKVDVVFRPDPTRLSLYPEIKRYLNQAVVFRDVPVGFKKPHFSEEYKSWGWRSSTSVRSQYVPGELLEEE